MIGDGGCESSSWFAMMMMMMVCDDESNESENNEMKVVKVSRRQDELGGELTLLGSWLKIDDLPNDSWEL